MDNDFLIELRDALKSVEDSEYPVLARAYYRRKIIAISTGCPVCCSIHGRGSSCPVGLAIAMIEKELAERLSVK